MPTLSRVVLFLLKASYLAYAQQCYYPDGTPSNDFPCNPNEPDSPCCGAGSICLSNKLCFGGLANTVRGSCASKDFTQPGCPNFCTDPTVAPGGTDVISCQNVTQDTPLYCCDHSAANCCDSGIGRFLIPPANPTTSAVWVESLQQFTLAVPISGSSSTRTTTSSTQTSSSTSTASSSITSATAPSSTSSSSSSSSAAADQSGLNDAAKIGIGVGVGLGAIVVALLSYIVWKLRRAPKPPPEQHNPMIYNGNGYMYHNDKHPVSYTSPPPSQFISSGPSVISELQPYGRNVSELG